MKLRNGFVSNSSSSSFIVKLDNVNNKIRIEDVLEALKIGEDSPLRFAADDIYRIINDTIQEYNKVTVETLAYESDIVESEFESEKDFFDKLIDVSAEYSYNELVVMRSGDGEVTYISQVDDDCGYDNPIEVVICRKGLKFKGRGFEVNSESY